MLTLDIREPPTDTDALTEWLDDIYKQIRQEFCQALPKVEIIGPDTKQICSLHTANRFGNQILVNMGLVIPAMKSPVVTPGLMLYDGDGETVPPVMVSTMVCWSERLTPEGGTEKIRFSAAILKGSKHPTYRLRPFDEALAEFELDIVYEDGLRFEQWGLPDHSIYDVALCGLDTVKSFLPLTADEEVLIEEPLHVFQICRSKL